MHLIFFLEEIVGFSMLLFGARYNTKIRTVRIQEELDNFLLDFYKYSMLLPIEIHKGHKNEIELYIVKIHFIKCNRIDPKVKEDRYCKLFFYQIDDNIHYRLDRCNKLGKLTSEFKYEYHKVPYSIKGFYQINQKILNENLSIY